MNCLSIGRGNRLAALILQFNKLVLPFHDICRRYLIHLHFRKIRQYLRPYDMLLGKPGISFQPFFHIRGISRKKFPELHIKVSFFPQLVISLIIERFPFCSKSPFLYLSILSVPVLAVKLCKPFSSFSIFISWHNNPSFP